MEKSGNTCGYVFSSYLKGVDGEEDYILSQCESGGYAIYEKESMELIEYSDTATSPYSNIIEEMRHYAGLANYYQNKGGKMKNLTTGEIVEKEKLEPVAKKIKVKLKKDRQKRKEISSNKGKSKKSISENKAIEGYTYRHTVICSCGYEYEKSHSFTYIDSSDKVHKRVCECGYTDYVDHYNKNGYCYYCNHGREL